MIEGGVGKTVQGSLPASDTTRLMYASMNPLDTGNGYTPQNTLRLVTRAPWKDAEESVRFKIIKVNTTNTPNRDGYSGLFLFGRYKDQHNLYYVGIRHDGQAVIKKKINGVYYTLAEKQLFGKQSDYDKWTKPNLIPQGKWLGLKAVFDNLADGSVRIRMYLDSGSGTYSYVLTTIDSGTGGAPFTATGKAGIRGDYMDIEFDDFELKNVY